MLVMDDEVQYLLYQKEVGKKGTPHFQGYIFLRRKKGFSTVEAILKRMRAGKAHIETCRGSHEENVAYCSKEDGRLDGPFEAGTPPQPGKRNDLVSLKSDLDSGMALSDVAERNFSAFIRYHGGISKYRFVTAPKRGKKKTKVLYF